MKFRDAIGNILSHDASALSVFGRLTRHDPSCLNMFARPPKCSDVTIDRACQCLEASQELPGSHRIHFKPWTIGSVGVWEAYV